MNYFITIVLFIMLLYVLYFYYLQIKTHVYNKEGEKNDYILTIEQNFTYLFN